MDSRWFLNRTNSEYIHYLSRSASISPVVAQVLINRGIRTVEEISHFLDPSLTRLADPYELPDMHSTVERLRSALSGGERILIHGDYDADGLCATAIMYQALKSLGANCHYFIPNRFTHGYGFNAVGVEKAKEVHASLIVTVDCGITSFDAVDIARREGIDVIITDHHEPVKNPKHKTLNPQSEDTFLLPHALAVINPKWSAQNRELANLSGAGIALKVVHALSSLHDGPSFTMHDFLDIATLGTIADMVPITGENRVIVSNGLPLIRKRGRPGIGALMDVSGMTGEGLNAGRLSFTLIPRLNAAGRMSDATDVVKLLTTESDETAGKITQWLHRLNAERQKTEEALFQEAVGMLKDRDTPSPVIVASESWHQGVVGIVASRIAEKFYRPAIVFSIEDGVAKGSARSIPSFDICSALACCSDLLMAFGGHKQAAGVTLRAEKLPAFEKKLCDLFDTTENIEKTPAITIDADVILSEINFNFIHELRRLEPFGFGNPEPLLGSRMLEVLSPRIVGNNHIRMTLRHKASHVNAIGFDMGRLFEDIDSTTIDAVFTASINEWNGGRHLQLVLKAFRPSR